MSFAATLFQVSGAIIPAVSFAQFVRGLFSLFTMVGFVMFFRPLLTGIARALVLTVRPALTREERAARRSLQNAAALQRVN